MNGYFIDWQLGFAIVIALTLAIFSTIVLLWNNSKLLAYCLELEEQLADRSPH